MKKYQVIETFSNGYTNVLFESDDREDSEKFYNQCLENDGEKIEDFEAWEIELNEVELDEDNVSQDCDTLKRQTMYEEGTKDRKYGGECPINFGYEKVYFAQEGECIYTFYFQGEKEKEQVKESQLENWFYK